MNKLPILIITSALCTITAYGMYQQPAMHYNNAQSQSQEVTISFGPFQGHQPEQPPTVFPSAPPAEYAPLPEQRSVLLAPNRRAENKALIESIGATECSTKMCAGLTALIACNFFKNIYLTFGQTSAETLSDIPLGPLIGVGIDWTLCLGAMSAGCIQEKRKITKETELLEVLDQLDQLMRLDTPSISAEKRANHPSFRRSRSVMINTDTEYETVPSPEAPLAVHQQQAHQITLYKDNGTLKAKVELYALFSTLLGALCLKDLILYSDHQGISALNTAVEGSLALGSLYLSYNAVEKQHEQEEIISAYESNQLH